MAVSNDKEFRDWLEKQTQEVCVAIAYRAAMRVLPLALDLERFNGAERLALSTFRAILTSGVASAPPTPDVKVAAASSFSAAAASFSASAAARSAAARSASDAFSGAAFSAAAAARSASDAAAEAASDAFSAAAFSAAAFSAAAASAAAAARSASEAAYADTDRDLATLAKSAIPVPEQLGDVISAYLAEGASALMAGGSWAFWANWYARAMAGDPLPWDLQEQIALIPNEVWQAGPEAVAAEIKNIEDEFYGTPLDAEQTLAAAEHLLTDPVVYGDIFANSSQSITVNVGLFQNKAGLNCLPDGFTGLEAIAGSFDALSQLLAGSEAKNIEIADLKGQIEGLHLVIGELRRELRETRHDLLVHPRLPDEAKRLAKIGRAAKETILLTGGLGGIAAGLLAALQLGDRWSDDYQGLRAEAHELADTMVSLEAPEASTSKK